MKAATPPPPPPSVKVLQLHDPGVTSSKKVEGVEEAVVHEVDKRIPTSSLNVASGGKYRGNKSHFHLTRGRQAI